jgi:superfamily II DNA or RNA helicase
LSTSEPKPGVITLRYSSGTLLIEGAPADLTLPQVVWDARAACHRAPGIAYAAVVLALRRLELAYDDQARNYVELAEGARARKTPRPYQAEAVEAWKKARFRGTVILPTGAGKTQVAMMAIDDRRRSALIVVPTLELVRQWYDLLRTTFGGEIGIVGGGEHTVRPLTVTTYDSAYIHMEHLGNRFGLIVFDEAHHLPSASYALAAELCLAPFRLGLTATPERTDGRESELDRLIGPIVFRREITELSGEYLSDYETERVEIELSLEEREAYEEARATYRAFIVSAGIRMGSPNGWGEFIMKSARSEEGRRAMKAYRLQRAIAFAAPAKLAYVEHLLERHRDGRTILFTDDNATAYAISRRFLVPVITHQTKVRERSEILERFSSGVYSCVATSRVLNEGVDVPDANVAIVVSGTGSVREHVQRLGRILRKKDGKRATLYELVSARTTEANTSERRREHGAYR